MLLTWARQPLSAAVAGLFAGGAQGYWFDNSRLDTIFQDAAGTVPGALEAPVGKQLDLSGRGNHRSQSTSANRPTLSALVNGLTKAEVLSNAAWTKSLIAATVGSGLTIPSKYSAYSLLTASAGAGAHYVYQSSSFSYGAGTSVTVTGWIAKGSTQYAVMTDASDAVYHNVTFDVSSTGTVSNSLNVTSATITQDENKVGFYFKVVYTLTNAGAGRPGFGASPNASTANTPNYTAAGTETMYITGVDIRPTDQATGLIPQYQRVDTVSAGGYDTVGFPQYDSENGSNSSMTTAGGGGGTTAFFWCAAVTIGKVGAAQTLYSDTGTNTGYRVRINASNQLELSAGNGTAYTTIATVATVNVGKTFVLTAWHDGVNLKVQINQGAINSTPFVTATAGTSSTTIGCDNGAATNFYLGRMLEIVHTINSVPTAGQIAATQAYCNSIGKAY